MDVNIQCWLYIELCSANIAYRSFVRWCWGSLGWRVRVVLPVCMVREVFRDYEFEHLFHIWGRVLENLLEIGGPLHKSRIKTSSSALGGPVRAQFSILASGVPGIFMTYRDLSRAHSTLSCSISLFAICDTHTPMAILHYPVCSDTHRTPAPRERRSSESIVPERTSHEEEKISSFFFFFSKLFIKSQYVIHFKFEMKFTSISKELIWGKHLLAFKTVQAYKIFNR